MSDPSQADIREQAKRFFERTLLSELAPPATETPVEAAGMPSRGLNWDVHAVNAIDETTSIPEQGATCRTVVLTSVTYVNTKTGEKRTVPITPAPPA